MTKMIIRKLALFVSCLPLLGCMATTGQFEKQFTTSKSVAGPVTIGKKQVPLPPGNWVVASRDSPTNNLNDTILSLILMNTDSRSDAMAVEIRTNAEASNSAVGWILLKACDRKDMLSPNPTPSYSIGSEECWFINHTQMTRSTKGASTRRKECLALF